MNRWGLDDTVMKHELHLGVIGLGPRGLMVLERIMAFSRSHPDITVATTVFEPNKLGCGSHPVEQPDFLRLNTISSQVSMFPGALPGHPEEAHFGPTLFDWCVSRDVRVPSRHTSSSGGHVALPSDFLPRRLLGEYLSWFHDYLVARMPSNMTVTVNATNAVDVLHEAGTKNIKIIGTDGCQASVRYCFITIGHSSPPRLSEAGKRESRTFMEPLPALIRSVRPCPTVLIEGFGLTAMDLMVGLIDEWGGEFSQDAAGDLRYHRSGREGGMLFFSRSGRPYCARPHIESSRMRHQPAFVSKVEIDSELRNLEKREFDFKETILPLMQLEMTVGYYACCAALEPHRAQGLRPEDIGPMLKQARNNQALASARSRLEAMFGRFDPTAHLALRSPPFRNSDDYQCWLLAYMKHDLIESDLGLGGSPLKSALEVWRDLRDDLRAIVDDQRFSDSGRDEFFRDYVPMINRLVAGPQLERIEEVICLLNAGVAEFSVGEGRISQLEKGASIGRRIDCKLKAFLPVNGAKRDDTPLLRNMTARGTLATTRSCGAVDGIHVSASGNAIGLDGVLDSQIWLFGPPAEGATYYNHYVPSPGSPSRAYVDANRAVAVCFALAAQSRPLVPALAA
jgi:FAD-NAD(P)-binding